MRNDKRQLLLSSLNIIIFNKRIILFLHAKTFLLISVTIRKIIIAIIQLQFGWLL